jgi:glycosyltransferase involved in cell wall biosynthesis
LRKIAVIGTAGVPANYGGFETLVENLVQFHNSTSLNSILTVYCSKWKFEKKEKTYLQARLKYIPLKANGIQSIFYDIWSIASALWNKNEVILLLGVSGAVVLPIVRLVSSVKIITNIDGIEWRRAKWRGIAKIFLKSSEKIAIQFSHEIISDNDAIASYVLQTYNTESHVIAYGGDHALVVKNNSQYHKQFPENFSFSVCRIEPENNVHLVLEAFSAIQSHPLVFVGNWMGSEYGKKLRANYSGASNIFLLDPIYDLEKLASLRANSACYIHGHSAGGTNPSLVEAMHFGKPVFAFDCDFNRCTTENKAIYFSDHLGLRDSIEGVSTVQGERVGADMAEIASRRYVWSIVSKQYFDLLAK